MKKYLMPVLVFVLGFAAAVVFVHPGALGSRPGDIAVETARKDDIRAVDLSEFFQAVSRKDFPAMSSLGGKIFTQGRKVSDAGSVFSGYETNSFPPFTVYALYTENTADKTRRVLLTLNGEGVVESFMAEEMSIIK